MTKYSLGLFLVLSITRISSAENDNQAATDSRTVSVQRNIVYGWVHGAALIADFANPRTDNKKPAIISLHGGRWKAGNKNIYGAIDVAQWADLGFFAMTIDYRLRGCSPPPACYQDVQCAIRYLHAHADQYHIDEDRIFLIGQSAGGHMVSLAATLGNGKYRKTGGWEEARNDICAAICVSGALDLTTCPWGDLWTPNYQPSMEAREYASPIKHVNQDMRPLIIFHADNDKSVPIENALSMVEELKAKNAPFVFHHYAAEGHMNVTPEVIKRSLEFIETVSENKGILSKSYQTFTEHVEAAQRSHMKTSR
ncbi:prolyl oligopeptidase family serine peptidase [Thalassoroseus pseudoceratinae]|uniref:prolyl oligopeptidase family serine peptidase n=1 Tax=Thalassoroseus pseudoceratinae TaxID=2713176 RepID=UPI00141F3195|nr:prolyl oligopeptidase family serine peptidase [Thalassoroseus pseudoceratinae]